MLQENKSPLASLTLSVAVVVVMTMELWGQNHVANNQLNKHRPLIIAHRGNSSKAPENTLPAFQQAVALKVDFVELDYVHSSDGVPIVIHDKDLDRTTDAVRLWGKKKLLVKNTPLDRLRQLDAGKWFDAKHGTKYAGAKVPTLTESLDVIQTGSITLIERKAGDAKTLVKLLREKRLTKSVIVQAFDWEFLQNVNKMAPEITLMALGSKRLSHDKLTSAKATGSHGIGWNHKDLDRANVQAAIKQGLSVWCYTVNDKSRAKELIGFGVSGLITDVPATMLPLRKATDAATPK